ncbi:MAG: hypothetical protein A3F40_02425 [Chlamydiae bacterium RIFCSPHIGHO2_12_FULL_27_8]|nr:MAG: hypothetical protein A3F40_02425 [Chlamydiae bacterium RIFCSPHIGHO2_12_FULL_27_8]
MGVIIKKNILITGARFFTALDLARAFHRDGHNIFVCDSKPIHLCAFSNTVKKSFKIPSPRFEFENFKNKLKDIILENKIDIVIPVFEETLYVAKAKSFLSQFTEVFCSSIDLVHLLHNKWTFHNLLVKEGIPTIPTYKIDNIEDIEKQELSFPYVLKASYSRGSFTLKKIEKKQDYKNLKILKKNPWIKQKWIEGQKFCSYSIVKNGKLIINIIYPLYVKGIGYCLTFENIENKKIEKWIADFVKKINFTGQISFDFIEDFDGNLFAIECNPRATSGLHLAVYHNKFSDFFINQQNDLMIMDQKVFTQLAVGMILYGLKQRDKSISLLKYIKNQMKIKDVVFSKKDLKPFLFQFFLYVYCFYESFKNKLPIPISFINDLNWDEEIEF